MGMTNRRKKPDVVRVFKWHGQSWTWERYRGIGTPISGGCGLSDTKRKCLRLARELNPGCTFEIEESK